MIKKSKQGAVWRILLVLLCIISLSGCAQTEKAVNPVITRISDLAGKKAASLTGSVFASVLDDAVDGVTHLYFNDLPSQLEAVENKKADAALLDEPVARLAVSQHPDLVILEEELQADSYGFAFKKGDPLAAQASSIITQFKEDGVLREMEDKWFGDDESAKTIPEFTYKNDYDGNAGVLHFSHDTSLVPMCYAGADGRGLGFDVELAKRIAYELNMKFEPTIMDFSSLIMSLGGGKSDMVGGCMSITEERKKSVDFSESYYQGGMVAVVRRSAAAVQKETEDSRTAVQGAGITTLAQLSGKKIGMLTGSIYDKYIGTSIPEGEAVYFNNLSDQVEALKAGKIAALIYDEPGLIDIMQYTKGVTALDEVLGNVDFGLIAGKDKADLIDKIDEMLAGLLESGELKQIQDKWFGEDESKKILPDFPLPAVNGVLRVATNAISPPNAYIKENKVVGYEVELAMYAARELGMGFEITDMDFAALIPAVSTGKADLAVGQISITSERSQSVLFTTPCSSSRVCVLVRTEDIAPADMNTETVKPPWYQSFVESFEKTFITENRYQLILQGLGTTLLISIFSAIFGTLLGFGVCLMRRTQKKWLNIPAKLFVGVIQGTPIVVMLMILFYIILGGVDISPVLVAIIGFSVNFAAYVSEMMRTGIDAVDKGQQEAASAIGFNKIQVFIKITMPQALRHVLPVFKGEFISMIKMTSVVGYIAIQDLTKMSDIIRSRTYEAFFPLIATALIYLALSYLVVFLLSGVEYKVDPKHRRRIVKGVTDK